MNTNDQIETVRPLYGLYVIISIQIIALTYLLYDEFIVSTEPRNWLLIIAGGGTMAIAIGLLLRNNIARLVLVFFCCVSILLMMIGLALVLIRTWATLTSNEILLLLVEGLVPLTFTIWAAIYLTRERVRSRFTGGSIIGQNNAQ